MITFGDVEMEKRKLNPYKDLIFSNNVNIDSIFNILYKKTSFGEKYYDLLVT